MKLRLAAMLTAILLAATCAGALAEDAVVTVRGTGTVALDADRATITVGVREVADDVKAAQAAVNGKIDSIISTLTDKGIEAKNLYTNSIGIYPNYDYSSSSERIVGYTAYNTITATTADIKNAGTYVDAAFDAGANTLDTVGFFAEDTESATSRALALAVADAREKAQVLAEAAGLKLGDIRSIREESTYNFEEMPMYSRAAAAAEDAGTQVLASQQQVSANVVVEFTMRPAD